jgi:Mg-chelatase subunit ChlI
MVILKTARAQAAYEGRTSITTDDIMLAAELALPHRLKRTPLGQSEVSFAELQERLNELVGQRESQPSTTPRRHRQEAEKAKKVLGA